MRLLVLLASTSLLAACGGGGPPSVSSAPPPTGGGTGPTTPGNTVHSFANPTEAKTYSGVGANHVTDYLTDARECCNQQGITYAGNSTTPRDSSISIAYDPADAIYTIQITDDLTGAGTLTRYQDPASRTDFGGAVEPQWGTPELSNPNYRYLQAGDGNPRSLYEASGTGFVDKGDNDTPPDGDPGSSYQAASLFVIEPGSETQYVTLAGYVRNEIGFETLADTGTGEVFDSTNWHLERGAFTFGEITPADSVPVSGTGTYSGSMLATMVFNPTLDGQDGSGFVDLPNYFQWIEGTADLAVDFANSSFELDLNGTVLAPQIDRYTGPPISVVEAGSQFSASGIGDINLINFGGFKGFFESASFAPAGGGLSRGVNIAGSTINGTFYGPNGEEIGGGYRIVGGNPDERVDILGAFIGQK